MTAPSVTVTLLPSGSLAVALAGPFGGNRLLPLEERKGEDAPSPTEVLRRILLAIQRAESNIGLDGAPTRAQVEHWQRHQGPFGFSSRCPFCLSEERAAKREGKSSRRVTSEKRLGGGVVVRRISTGVTAAGLVGAAKAKETKARTAEARAKALVSKGSSRDLGF